MGLSLAAQAQVTVVSRQPARHARAVPATAAVAVGFSQPITAASAANLRVYGGLRQGKRAGSVSGGGTATLTFTPSQGYAPGEVLTVSVPASLASTSGGTVARQVYQFTAATGGPGKGFFLDTARVGNTATRDQVLGDIDNDGDLDLLTTGALFGCRVFLNDGTGKYTFKTGFPTGEVQAGLALLDVNQDGYLDVLSGDSKNNLLAVRLNDGTGDFALPTIGYQNAPVGAGVASIATGDVDGDGDQDFVTANTLGGSSTVWFNSGSYLPNGYYFTTNATVNMGGAPTAVVLGDIDNDGDLDLLTANASGSTTGEVHVSRNSGAGSFGAYSTVAVGLQPSELTLADLDGDGDLDLLTANAGAASVSVRLNNGSGTFSGTTTLALPAGSTPSGLRTGDLDADGDPDLVVAQGRGGRIITYLNTAGTLAAQGRALRLSRDASLASVGVTLGDVDGDGDLDLLTSDDNGEVLLSRNVGPPSPLPAPTITGLAPDSGPVGTPVVLTGTSLTDVTGVFFNGLAAPGFALTGAGTSLRVAVPAGASSGPVTVATEEAGTATSPGSFTVTVPVPVLLTGIVPGRNASNVPLATNVVATFQSPITAATADNVRVFGSQRRGRRPGSLTGGGTAALTFDPAQDFAPGERVSVSLPASLRAADGNGARPQVVQFTAAVGGTGQANFTAATTLAGPRPGEPVVGDLDNDGDLDLLVPNYGANTVSVRLNNGAGTFSNGPDLAAGANVSSLVTSDVDADGDIDLVLVYTFGTVRTWLNQGNATFVSGSTLAATTGVSQLVLGDLDADGDQDLLLLFYRNAQVQLNDGAGNFAAGPIFYLPEGIQGAGLGLGDIDNDGDLDLLVGGESLSAYRNDGTGQFGTAQPVAPTASPGGLALGDLDGDGDLDLVARTTLNGATRLTVCLNNGTGTFGSATNLPLDGPRALLADVDADGDLDLVARANIGLNDGTGAFRSVIPTGSSAFYNSTLAAGDLDGDGDLDLVTGEDNDVVSIRLNQPRPAPTLTALAPGSGPVGTRVLLTGTGFIGVRAVTFNGQPASSYTVRSATELVATVPAGATTGPVAVTTPAGTGTSATSFVVAEPIAVTSLSPARHAASAPRGAVVTIGFAQPISAASAVGLRVLGAQRRGQRPGTLTGGGTAALTFTPAQAFAPGEAVSVTIPGSLAGTAAGRVRPQVYQFTAAADGPGTGLFMPLGTADVPIYYRAIDLAVGDLDNDGDQDFVTTDGSIRLNDGHGAFASPTGVELSSDPWGIAVGDLNNDGLLDLVTTNGDVRLNLGAAVFDELPSLTNIPANIRDLALGDLDGDGDLDLVLPTYATDSVCVRFNDGTGRFPTKRLLAVGNRPVGVAIGDVDNDGQLDIVAASEGYGSNASTLHICFNSGNGLFDRKNVVAGGSYLQRVVLGDLDADGDLDLVTNTGYVRLNDGTGNFTGTQTTAANQGLALGDVDGDGDLDLLATGNLNSALRLNDGRGNFSAGPAPDLGNNWGNVVLADLDDDGDLDAATTDNSARVIRLRLNHHLAPPAALSFAPARGLPGELVIVTGTDLVGTTAVSFNGTAAPGFVLNSAFQLTVRVPAGATSGPISVTNPKGTATSAQSFTVLAPVPVLSVSPAPNAVAPLTAPVVVRFGQALAAHTTGNLAVFSAQGGGQLAGTRQGAGSSTLTLVPARPYQPGEQVRVSLPAYTEANSLRVVRQVYQFTAAVGGTGRGFFAEPVSFPRISTSGGSMVLGDVDGDGDQDLLTGTFNTVQVQLNNGAGAYSAAGTVPVADNPASLTLGDVDGDGDLDLTCTSFGGRVVSVRLNDGAGRFSGTANVPVGDSPNDVALADMDADGDLDLVTINSGSYSSAIIPVVSFSVRFNDGGGNFSGTEDVTLDAITHHGVSNITLGDLDGDGDLDVAAGAAGYLFIYLNDGLGHLASAYARLSPPDGTENISMNDVDADGDLDLLVLGSSSTGGVLSTMSVLRNDGRATFTATSFSTVANTNSMVVGDLDADGDVDILIANPGANGQLWLNDGRGTFARLLDLPLRSTDGQPILRDVDGDGDLDLLTSAGGGAFNVRLNGPTPPPVVAGFTPATGPAGTAVTITGSGFLGTTAVRFNGTLAPGFVINSPSQLTVRVPEGATTGFVAVTSPVATATSSLAFTVLPKVNVTGQTPAANAVSVAPGTTISLTFASAVTAATAGSLRVFGSQRRGRRPGSLAGGDTPTLTFDPAQDFAPGERVSVSLPATLRTANGGLVRRQVYQFTAATGGTGRGLFRAGPNFSPGWYASDLAVGDIDNDGDLDLLTPVEAQYTGANVIAVRLNDGQGRFSAGAGINIGTSTSPTRLVLGDVDADGDLDLVVSYGGFAVSVCLNQGSGTFATAVSVSNVPCSTLALGDVDADGDLDLVMASYQYSSLQVALNDGSGRFGTPSAALDSPNAMTVTLGDVDGDGDLDALSANPTGPRLYLNDGEGTFAAGVVLPVAGEVRDVALGDLDADGDLDVAVSSHDASWLASLTLLRNQGNGSFATGPRVALGTYTNRLCLGDLDHDGDLDAVATNGSSDDVALRLNDGTGTFSVLANVPVSTNPIALALADLDGDGDLDFAALQSATGGALVNIRLNDSQPLATAPAAAGGVPVLLYPNPAHGQFVVAVPAALRLAAPAGRSLQLHNALGQLVLEQPLRLSASGEQAVDVSSLPAGIYTLRLPLSSGPATYKISVY
jgi:hypothetical protein